MSIVMGKVLTAAPALAVLALTWALVELAERIRCYRRARREQAQLLAMSDRELRDLGLSRVDAIQVATRAAWRDCTQLGRTAP